MTNTERARPSSVPPPPIAGIPFLTDAGSPFPDGYSIEKETEALAYMEQLSDDAMFRDPNYPRFEMLHDRREQLQRMRSEFKGHNGADRAVPYRDTQRLRELGRLITSDDAGDVMLLHTRQAFRLFVGRRADPERKLSAIPSAMRIGTVLKVLHDLSQFDNPYADWALLRAAEHIERVRLMIVKQTSECRGQLQKLEEKGMRISILRSAKAQEFQLQFRSPYGYMLCELLVDFDQFVRLVLTMSAKGQLSDTEVRPKLSPIIGALRSFFGEMVRYERVLASEHMRALSRRDYLPDADETARKRVDAATGIFGLVPEEIFTAAIVPPHTKRRANATPQDIELLGRLYEAISADDAKGSEAHTSDADAESLL